MKHGKHCHCGLGGQIKKFKAGQLGIFGGILIIGHLLFHVAECLVLPAFLMMINGNTAEATSEVKESEISETSLIVSKMHDDLQVDFTTSLELYKLKIADNLLVE